MTPAELVRDLLTTFGSEEVWPNQVVVDRETYGACCQAAFDEGAVLPVNGLRRLSVVLGPHRGLLFRQRIELLLLRP